MKIRSIAALCIVAPMLLAAAPFTSPQGRPVEKVEVIDGASGGPAHVLPGKLKTREGDRFDQSDFDADLKALSNEYERVEPQIDVQDDQVQVTLTVWNKPLIRNILWSGNKAKSDEKLTKKLEIESGQPFDRSAFQKGFNKVKTYYVDEGFREAELDYQVVQVSPCEVDIQICVNEGESQRIRKVFVCGVDCEELDDIQEMLLTREHNFLISWLTEWGTYQADMVEYDRQQVLRYLQDRGYADATVTVSTCCTRHRQRIVVTFTIDKGEKYYFGEVVVRGEKLIFPTPVVTSQVVSRQCDHFSVRALQDSIEGLTNLYGAKGYIEPDIQYELQLRPDERCYNVVYTIEPGEQFRVGLVKICGNRQTECRVILHETLITPGEVFNLRRLKATEQRLKNVGYFKTVRVYTTPSTDGCLGPEYRDVVIEVEEENTGSLSIFGGFSTLDRIFGGLELSERNFNIRGLAEGPTALRGGGEYAQARVTIGQNETSYLAKWTKPYFYDTRWIVGFDLEHSNNRQYSDLMQVDNTSGLLHFTYPYRDYLRFGTLYRLEWSYDKIWEHTSDKTTHKINEKLHERRSNLVSAVGGSVSYDSTNAMSYPTNGTRSEFLAEVAGVGGPRFVGLSYLNTVYVPLSLKHHVTMKFRGDLRVVQPYGGTLPEEVPFSERLLLGGEDTVRGYRSYSIGPRFNPNAGRNPSGGLSSALFSEEVQWRMTKFLAPFVFVDAGMVARDPWQVETFRVSTGFGVCIDLLPNMPVTLGMGWPINPKNDSQIQRFFFAIGAKF
jgi:outer membrane protein insertion porin family